MNLPADLVKLVYALEQKGQDDWPPTITDAVVERIRSDPQLVYIDDLYDRASSDARKAELDRIASDRILQLFKASNTLRRQQ